jgi:hypothetical protein
MMNHDQDSIISARTTGNATIWSEVHCSSGSMQRKPQKMKNRWLQNRGDVLNLMVRGKLKLVERKPFFTY